MHSHLCIMFTSFRFVCLFFILFFFFFFIYLFSFIPISYIICFIFPLFQFRIYQLLPMPPIVKPYSKQIIPIRVILRLQPLHSVRTLSGHWVFSNGFHLLHRPQCLANQSPNLRARTHTQTLITHKQKNILNINTHRHTYSMQLQPYTLKKTN